MQEIQEGALAGDGWGRCTSGVSRRPIGPICPIGPTAVPKAAQEMQERPAGRRMGCCPGAFKGPF